MIARAPERLQTPRMSGERLRPDHGAELAVLMLDPRVAQTLWPLERRPTESDVLQGLAQSVEHWRRHGFGMWLLRDRATGAIVGRGGPQQTHLAGVQEIEIAWAIAPERRGEGLATEVALASVQVAFRDLGCSTLVAFTLPDNAASRRVMEKSGLRHEREIVRAGLPHVLYRRERGAPT